MLPLTITAIRGNWARFMARKRNPRFLAIQHKIFDRDKYTCGYCGFKSTKFLEIVNADHNYNNNKLSNLLSACPLCYQCFFLDYVGRLPNTGGHIIYLPEVTQADLNNFCRGLFAIMLKDAPYKGKLHSIYLSLQDRSSLVESIFGPESSKPHIFGQTLIDSQTASSNEALHNLRLLPARKPLAKAINYWKQAVYDAIPL